MQKKLRRNSTGNLRKVGHAPLSQRFIFELLNVLHCSFWKNGDRALIIYGEYQTRIRTFLTRPLPHSLTLARGQEIRIKRTALADRSHRSKRQHLHVFVDYR